MIKTIAQYAGYIAAIMSAFAICVKPLREKLFDLKALRNGQLCTLRNQMLQIYRTHKDDKNITEDEYNSFKMSFDAYKALGGNSFIVKIWREIDTEWNIEV